jgi:hypothetical protein
MSSLWASFKKKDNFSYDREVFGDNLATVIAPLLELSPVLINATSLVANLKSQRVPLNCSWDLTPGFPFVWIEYMTLYEGGNPGRAAVAILRTRPDKASAPDNATHSLIFYTWCESKGQAGLTGLASVLIDAKGIPLPDSIHGSWDDEQEDRDQQFSIALETLTTMNTRGTRIEPPVDAKPVQVVKPDRAPFSVWHTIHLPKMPSIPLEDAETSETILERREHWVRAHRRDYRHGAGMFGRVKALVWVPEFQRGNPELGAVKQSYDVRQPEAGK